MRTTTTIPGLEIDDRVVGHGAEAGPVSVVVAQVRMFLSQGEEIFGEHRDLQHLIYLGKTHTIAGLRYGMDGMRIGGVREIVIHPDLAYGKDGVPGVIPQDATLRCEVRLLSIRDHVPVEKARV
jgi:FKBP-type peptidyl-prolyl cis-trans isomerase